MEILKIELAENLDIVLPEILADLNLDYLKGYRTGIFYSMEFSGGDERALTVP